MAVSADALPGCACTGRLVRSVCMQQGCFRDVHHNVAVSLKMLLTERTQIHTTVAFRSLNLCARVYTLILPALTALMASEGVEGNTSQFIYCVSLR